jgi:hypothetical protein
MGSGFFDVWSNPAGAPNTSEASHWVGSQAFHYTRRSDSGNYYGWQIALGSSNPSYMYVRGIWSGTGWGSWYRMHNDATAVCSAIASFNAPRFIDSNDTTYYGDFASTSVVNAIKFGTSTNNGTISGNGTWGMTLQTDDGYLQFGPANSSHAHIYTGSPNIYANAPITVSGSSIMNQYDIRSKLFYDVDNTAYYGDFASNSNINTLTSAGTVLIGGVFANNAYNSTSGSRLMFGGEGATTYYIGTNMENVGGNYNKLDLRWHTGIRMGARPVYGGIRIYDNEVMGTQIMSMNNQYDGLGANNIYINNSLQVGTSVRTAIFYEASNTAFYLDPASTGTSLNVAGDVVAYASSDIRFKNNVTPITNALDKINKIGGYTFEWNEKSHKETGKKDIGVIAQEVEEILPEIVDTRDNGYKAVDYSKLTALLIQSVKEQQVIIDSLKSRIETLENN